jgi:hypothetical protein
MIVMTFVQGKERRFAEFEASILSRKSEYEFYAKQGGRKVSI